MKRCLLCTSVFLAGLTLPVLGQEDFVASEPLHAAGLVKFWQLQLPLEPDQEMRELYLVDDQLYLSTQDGWVYAVDAYTGAIRWLQKVTGAGYRLRPPAHAGEHVVFVTPMDIQVYDRFTGDGLTRRELRFPSGSGAVYDGQRLFIGGLDNRLYAFDAQTLTLEWRVTTEGPIVSLPVIYGDFVYFATEGGYIYSCTRDKKAQLWPVPALTFGPVQAALVADEAGVYVASRDRSLYQFDLMSGRIRWQARLGAPLYEAPVLLGDLAFQYSQADGLAAVETALDYLVEKRVRWQIPTGRQALTIDDKHAYIRTTDENLLVVRRTDGEIVYTIPAPGFTLGVPAGTSASVYLVSPRGRLFCARPRGTPLPTRADLINALRPPNAERTADIMAVAVPTTQPATETEDYLTAKRQGVPIGGKSKVSQEFGGAEGE